MTRFYLNNTSLIESLKKGDPKAYTYMVDTYHSKLCVYAYNLIHDHDAAEDIVQNVFIRVWKKRNQLNPQFSLQNFLYRSVYNEFIDHYRKSKSVIPLEKKHIDTLSTIIEEDDNSLDKLIALVKQEIENLPPKCKQAFLLSKQEGLTNIEIAEYLNVSIKTVEAHITGAFSLLRKSIGSKTNSILFLVFGKSILLSE